MGVEGGGAQAAERLTRVQERAHEGQGQDGDLCGVPCSQVAYPVVCGGAWGGHLCFNGHRLEGRVPLPPHPLLGL